MNLAWHFVRLVDGRPVLRDGMTPVPLGHLSWETAAACLVEVDEIAAEQTDKLVCRRRRVLGWVACDDLLRLFAREAALSVAQFWTMPPIVREYLETGDESTRDAAWDAAWDAARDAAWAAARAAARDAAWDAAWDDLNALLESILLGAIGGAR